MRDIRMRCIGCNSETAWQSGENVGGDVFEYRLVCGECGMKFVASLEIVHKQARTEPPKPRRRQERPPVFRKLGIDPADNKKTIIAKLGAVYAVENLGDALFIKRPAIPESFRIDLESGSDRSVITKIRRITDTLGHRVDETLYEA